MSDVERSATEFNSGNEDIGVRIRIIHALTGPDVDIGVPTTGKMSRMQQKPLVLNSLGEECSS